MNKSRFFIYCAAFTVLVLAVFVINTDLAIAQQANDDQDRAVIEEIVKIEAKIDRNLVGPPNASGARTEIFEIRQEVSFADLDLRKVADVTELQRRIENTAKELCETLRERYPLLMSGGAEIPRCIREAIKSTDDDLETVVSAE